ncbi:MAG: hypothetical protein JNK33_00955 [Candidatus Doudnabacteria bacterium]|nr:hypothetical protein [Candidatus Doudnabacteria bacterium]
MTTIPYTFRAVLCCSASLAVATLLWFGGTAKAVSTNVRLEIQPPYQCSDGLDNDFDGAIDFPADTSCTSASGLSEYTSIETAAVGGGAGPVAGSALGRLPDPRVPFKPHVLLVPRAQEVERYMTFSDVAGGSRTVPVFTTNRPKFVGKTDLKNAQVIFTVRADVIIRGSANTDNDGNFSWQAPEFISGGLYTLLVTVQDEEGANVATTAVEFLLDIEPVPERTYADSGSKLRLMEDREGLDVLFDIFVKINPRTQTVQKGGTIDAVVDLINFGSPNELVDVPLQYYVENEQNKRVLAVSETRAVRGQLSVAKLLTLPAAIEPGLYTLLVTVPSRKEVAIASDTFVVHASNASSVVAGQMGLISEPPPAALQTSFAIVAMSVLILYVQYTRVATIRYRSVVGEDLQRFIE